MLSMIMEWEHQRTSQQLPHSVNVVQVYLLYVKSAGLVVTAVTLLSLTLMQATAAGFNYWLSHWATQQVLTREALPEILTQ